MATRYKADVSVMEKPWGESFSYEEIKYEIETKKPAIFAIVHAETSSGVLQPLDGIGDVCRKNNCLFLVDAVTSLGALELLIDEWKIDLAYSCSQKGLSCPPGLRPFTMNNRAEEKLSLRKTKAKAYHNLKILFWLQILKTFSNPSLKKFDLGPSSFPDFVDTMKLFLHF